MLGIILGVIVLNLCVIYLRYETEILLGLFPEIDKKPVPRRRICKKQPARVFKIKEGFGPNDAGADTRCDLGRSGIGPAVSSQLHQPEREAQ
jgi:hypothetical protein